MGLLSITVGGRARGNDSYFLRRSLDQRDHLVEWMEEVEVKVIIFLLDGELHGRKLVEQLVRKKEMGCSVEQEQRSTGDE